MCVRARARAGERVYVPVCLRASVCARLLWSYNYVILNLLYTLSCINRRSPPSVYRVYTFGPVRMPLAGTHVLPAFLDGTDRPPLPANSIHGFSYSRPRHSGASILRCTSGGVNVPCIYSHATYNNYLHQPRSDDTISHAAT